MTRPIPVLINRSGGMAERMGSGLRTAIADAFAATGRPISLEILRGVGFVDAVSRHADSALIVVGGGDGTISAAASVLAGRRTAMGILPLGTRNHLARQLGLPLDLAAAVHVAIGGQRRRIDVGVAGSRVFVNNASFGIYTRFVRARDAMNGAKWLDILSAAIHALRQMRAQHFSLRINGLARELATPLLFVGNNSYSIGPDRLGQRESLTDGELSVFALSAKRPAALLFFAARALVGMARPERDFRVFATARDLVIDGEGLIEGAFDGELEVLSLPLVIRSLPGALGVVTPREPASIPSLTRDSLTDRTH